MYEIALSPQLENLHNVFQLIKYVFNPTHVLEEDEIWINENLSLDIGLVQVLGFQVKKLREKDIHTMKVLWNEETLEAT